MEWKDIDGYEGKYRVNQFGEVYSVRRTVKFGKATRIIGGTVLRQRHDTNGYAIVCLCDGRGDKRPKKVHRIVAEAFIPNPGNLPCVNHKDEDKDNNDVSNLEWCTVEYNNNYGTHQQRSSLSRINHPKRSKAVRCVETGIIYPSMREAERKTGVNQSQIWHCIKTPHKTARGFHWAFVKEGDYYNQ